MFKVAYIYATSELLIMIYIELSLHFSVKEGARKKRNKKERKKEEKRNRKNEWIGRGVIVFSDEFQM